MGRNRRLYELLHDRVGEEAAAMIADSIPPEGRTVTTADLSRELTAVRTDLKREIEAVRTELKGEIAELREEFRTFQHAIDLRFAAVDARFAQAEANFLRWMLTMFVPVWLGLFGVIATLIVKG